jgi:hypothetical protein
LLGVYNGSQIANLGGILLANNDNLQIASEMRHINKKKNKHYSEELRERDISSKSC